MDGMSLMWTDSASVTRAVGRVTGVRDEVARCLPASWSGRSRDWAEVMRDGILADLDAEITELEGIAAGLRALADEEAQECTVSPWVVGAAG